MGEEAEGEEEVKHGNWTAGKGVGGFYVMNKHFAIEHAAR